ncbi:Neural Cell Adhesion Molecule L1-Like Protein [Manis pentadactyla]|nr:Neural Cell Adhesion Molecule L1-Like Protein [Manis pentadactyla]
MHSTPSPVGMTIELQALTSLRNLPAIRATVLGAEKFHPFTLKVKRVNTRMGNHGTDPSHAWVASGENNISTEPIHKGHRCPRAVESK